MARSPDLKSVVRKDVRVRLPPSAPLSTIAATTLASPNVNSVLLAIKRRQRPLIAARDIATYREFVQYGFGRWKPNLKMAFKTVFTYKQWKWLARNFDFPLDATVTQLSVEQWRGLYHALKHWRGENCQAFHRFPRSVW